MMKIGAQSVVTTLVQCLLPKGGSIPEGADKWTYGGPVKALAITLDMRVSTANVPMDLDDDDWQDDVCGSADLHIVVVRKSNYTTIFTACGLHLATIPLDEWEYVTHHDSGWRSAVGSKISEVYETISKQASDEFDALWGKSADEKPSNHRWNKFCTVRDVYMVEVQTEDLANGKQRIASIKLTDRVKGV